MVAEFFSSRVCDSPEPIKAFMSFIVMFVKYMCVTKATY